MHESYLEWPLVKRVEYWYGQAIFFDRMQSSVTDGYINVGLYVVNKAIKEKLKNYELNWDVFEKKLCERFKIDVEMGRKMFNLSSNEDEWRRLAMLIEGNKKD